jgi:ABC-type branched-subunit amino acid transport system substrate-binding protein
LLLAALVEAAPLPAVAEEVPPVSPAPAAVAAPAETPQPSPAPPAMEPDPGGALPALQPPRPASPAVGVLLPLSGRYAPFGEQVRRGLELALALRPAGRPLSRLLLRDAGTDPEQNARAVAELAADPSVLAVAGPLTSAAALAAAGQAQQARLPLLTLSQREGLPGVGDYVFRASLTGAQQVRALVGHAVERLGLKSFAVLYPEHKLGREMAELFAREVERRGGRVVARQGYAETDTDFRRPIRLLQGRDPGAPEPESPIASPFAALFIPDDAERVGLILPQLAYYGLEGVQLLGSSGWNAEELLVRAGSAAEGAVFVEGFFAGSLEPAVSRFVGYFRERYGEDPSLLEAQGFDAASILLALLDRPEVESRDDLRQGLARLHDFPGATGRTSFDPQGEAQRPLFLLQVRDGAIVQID